jgi:hypothetical protein
MNEDFHKPFIKSLVIVGLVTIFAMVSSHYLVDYYFSTYKNTPIYTSSSPESSLD